MASARTWVLSLAAAGGVAGGGAAGLTVNSSTATADPTSPPGIQRNAADAGTVQREVAALLAEDRALHTALAQTRRRLGGQIKSREAALAELQKRLASTEAALRAQRAGLRAAGGGTPTATPNATPAAHATTGASGTSGTGPTSSGGRDG